jgi:hypothetical protein
LASRLVRDPADQRCAAEGQDNHATNVSQPGRDTQGLSQLFMACNTDNHG